MHGRYDFCFVGRGFSCFSNPLTAGQPLQILLENDFSGTVELEVLSLYGRVLHTFFREKTGPQLVERVEIPEMAAGAFLVRVSDGKGSAVRRVLRF